MDAYVLGTHTGDLPTHILGDAGSGRVRAMSQLEGAPHSIFAAVEGDSPEALEDALAAVRGAGVADAVALTLNPEADDVGTIIINLIHVPARIPPWELLVFVYLEAELILETLEAAVEALGAENVAVASDGQGRVLIELGGPNASAVQATADALAGAHKNAVVGRVAGAISYAKDG